MRHQSNVGVCIDPKKSPGRAVRGGGTEGGQAGKNVFFGGLRPPYEAKFSAAFGRRGGGGPSGPV